MSKGRRLRELMESDGMALAPGAYDGMTAKLIQQADFSCVYMTGGGTSSSYGYPDYGLITMSEMVANAGRIADGQVGHRGSPIIHRNRLEARIAQANFVEALKHELLGFESLFIAGTADAERDDAPDLSEHACRREGQLFFPCCSLRSGR